MSRTRSLRYHIDEAEKHIEYLETLKQIKPHKIDTLNELSIYWKNKIKEWKTSMLRLNH